jgi:hypothetical protein
MSELNEVDQRLSVHEAICAERYIGINAQLKRIEMILFSTAGALILGLAAIAWSVASSR